jgi:predicted permease
LLPGETERTSEPHETMLQMVRENYFETLEIPFVRGRGFTAQDDRRSPRVGIVNQTLARKFFPDEDPLGKRVTMDKREVEIIGIVADTKYRSQREELQPLLCTSWRQWNEELGGMHFALRTAGEPAALAGSVRRVVAELDGGLPLTEVGSQTARSQDTLGQERLYARLLSFFGGLALLLAAIGLAGMLAHSVAQRTNEIGIRMALGARQANVLRLVIWHGMKLVFLGLAAGAACGYFLQLLLESRYFPSDAWQRQMAGLLYGVRVTDPATIAVIALLLTLVAGIACWLPARRAVCVDPLDALRHE